VDQVDVVAPKTIDPELTARAVLLVGEHRDESTVLLSGTTVQASPPSARH